jgi:oxygen-independent coproporphyrinogen-3 oxidase
MAGWLYWRIYETRFDKMNFKKKFRKNFDRVYGKYMTLLSLFGFLKDDGEKIVFSDKGIYWTHAFEDLFSLEYISKLWGTAKQEPWPDKVVL